MPRFTTSQGAAPVMSSPLNTMRPLSGRRILVIEAQQRGLAGAVRADQADDLVARSSKLTALTAVRPPKRLVSFRREESRTFAHCPR
jgi:hypothetical protein